MQVAEHSGGMKYNFVSDWTTWMYYHITHWHKHIFKYILINGEGFPICNATFVTAWVCIRTVNIPLCMF
jgi:hypothetical protein